MIRLLCRGAALVFLSCPCEAAHSPDVVRDRFKAAPDTEEKTKYESQNDDAKHHGSVPFIDSEHKLRCGVQREERH
jgi:hypothetical protein